MPPRLKICYLLESGELSGGVRVVLDQARALILRGHEVSVLIRSGGIEWYPHSCPVKFVKNLAAAGASMDPDVAVATFWTTVKPALGCQARLSVHLCQGCEWEFPEYEHIVEEIDRAYRERIPKLTIGPWLNDKIMDRFGPGAFPIEMVGQIVDTQLYRFSTTWKKWASRRREPPVRILIPGMFESRVKGVPIALEAVARLRYQGLVCELARVSPYPKNPAEDNYTKIDRYHEGIDPLRMAQLYEQTNILLAPSYHAEGFGLPFFEALACGTPAVATAIPSYLSLDPRQRFACFVPEGDSEAMANAMRFLLEHPERCFEMARRGVERVPRRFDKSTVAARLEKVFLELLGHSQNRSFEPRPQGN